MPTTGNTFKRMLALLFAVLFVVTLPLALVAYDAGSLLFSEPRMTVLLEDAALHSKLVPLALSWYAHTIAARYPPDPYSTPDYLAIMSFLTMDDWVTLRQIGITDSMLVEWTDATTAGAYGWLDNDRTRPNIQWAMRHFQQHLQAGSGEEALQLVYSTLPPCKSEQIEDFLQRQNAVPVGVEVPYNPCHFPVPWESDQYGDYLTSVEEMVAAIPPTLDLVSVLAPNTSDETFLTLKGRLRLARAVCRWGWLLPLALLGLIAALRRQTWGRWWSVLLALGGFATLGMYFLVPGIVLPLLASLLEAWPTELAAETMLFLTRVVNIIVHPLVWQSILGAGVGVLALLLMVFKGRQAQPATE